MTDLSVFAEAGFDAKAWINAACAGRPQQEPLERFLAELEMRLQVRSVHRQAGCPHLWRLVGGGERGSENKVLGFLARGKLQLQLQAALTGTSSCPYECCADITQPSSRWYTAVATYKAPLPSAHCCCALLCSVLQLGSEEVEQSLTDVSTAALRRVPFAQQEVSRLKGDVAGLQVCVWGGGFPFPSIESVCERRGCAAGGVAAQGGYVCGGGACGLDRSQGKRL